MVDARTPRAVNLGRVRYQTFYNQHIHLVYSGRAFLLLLIRLTLVLTSGIFDTFIWSQQTIRVALALFWPFFSGTSHIMSPFSAWTPGPGPLFTVLSETYRALHIPDLPIQYQTWISGESPLSTQKAVVAAIGTYLLVVFGGREIMR